MESPLSVLARVMFCCVIPLVGVGLPSLAAVSFVVLEGCFLGEIVLFSLAFWELLLSFRGVNGFYLFTCVPVKF
jgi:hypothetical protein